MIYTKPPKILITTARNPTQTIRTFCNDITCVIPNSLRINRGKSNLDTLAEKALKHKAERVIISDRWKGGLGRIQLFKIGNTGLIRVYPIIYLKSVMFRKTFQYAQTKTTEFVPIQTETEISFEAHELADALSHFLNTSRLSSEEPPSPTIPVVMQISLNNTQSIQIKFINTACAPQRIEIGPRISISHLIWKPRK